MRVIGMDVHRSFAATAVLEDGRLRKGVRVELRHDRLLAWARSLRPDDEVVLEATGNTAAIVRLVAPHVGRVAIANPVQVRAIDRLGEGQDRPDRRRHPGQAPRQRLPPGGLGAG